MLRFVVFSLLLLLFLITTQIIRADGHDDSEVHCLGEVKSGKLEVSHKIEETISKSTKIPEDCTSLQIRIEAEPPGPGIELNWDKIDRILLPNLKIFILHYVTSDPHKFTGYEFSSWKSISLFGYDPKEVTRLGIDSYVMVNEEQVLNFDGPVKHLSIIAIDPQPILKAIQGSGVPIETIHISDTKFKNGAVNFNPPSGVTSMELINVDGIPNFSTFLQKFKYLEGLWLAEHKEKIDLSDFLGVKTLNHLVIANATMTLQDTSGKIQSENLNVLALTDCIQDSSFKKNGWKVLPNLTTMILSSSAPEKLDLADLLVYKQLTNISLANNILTFTKAAKQYETLLAIELMSCEVDLNKFADGVTSTFSNLKYFTLDAQHSGTKPTQEFLNKILAKLPDIEYVSLDPFDLTPPSGRKGTFEVIYKYESHTEE